MKCPRCRAEIISDTVQTCPYCGSPLAIPLEKGKKAESQINHETSEIAKQIKEAIEAQKAIYKIDKTEKTQVTKKLEKTERKKYSSSDIAILFVSLALTFIVLAITLSLILKR